MVLRAPVFMDKSRSTQLCIARRKHDIEQGSQGYVACSGERKGQRPRRREMVSDGEKGKSSTPSDNENLGTPATFLSQRVFFPYSVQSTNRDAGGKDGRGIWMR